ncbi:carboxylesterase/lipase family protein [Dysgonomonas sp. Marseille-P4677]|uniref:carboxylesterase/lipase family protein n=1 Tax=Dysgonomonas sp. Marseille-P4677 TaxID=2364790 RepID=UPI001914BEB7|nr:carboxylesterase family protein [Dysgonomonas sp. Marseille-P4677]MBK5722198.1 carboxylesterase/lipase family protein [Dysgonomonas sp. Marseille-P4677]
MKSNRRKFIKNMGLATAALSVNPIFSLSSCSSQLSQANSNRDLDKIQVQIGEDIAVARTTEGKVKGYIMRDIYTFLGIPYAASTSGENRFMPPQKHKPWEGIRPTVFYGNSAPQEIYSRASTSYDMFIDQWNYDEVSEECLTINIWTQAIADGKMRPVIVWLHGGGFLRGNGIEQNGYHGENIARYGDVVYCSINHRLGAFGFTDFSSVGGDKYKDSGNVGILDIVAALEWINKNIENFGGDPNNVTVIGQSGGGAKVSILTAMPAAKGLIHKAVSLSGSAITANDKEYSQKLGEYILKEAKLTSKNIDKLQEMPWQEYMSLAHRAAKKYEKDIGGSGMRRGSFAPVADGVNIPQEVFYSNPSFGSPDIPMIFCSTFHESSPSRTNASMETISIEEVKDILKNSYRDKTNTIVDTYIKVFPNAKPIEILSLIYSNRKTIVEAATAKSKQSSPIYMAWFGWCPPLFDNRMRAFHCLDISFWFLNTDLMITHSGGGERPRKLAYKMTDALLSFARTGNPNCESLPKWPQFSPDRGETMIFNDVCEVKNDPDREARLTLD